LEYKSRPVYSAFTCRWVISCASIDIDFWIGAVVFVVDMFGFLDECVVREHVQSSCIEISLVSSNTPFPGFESFHWTEGRASAIGHVDEIRWSLQADSKYK